MRALPGWFTLGVILASVSVPRPGLAQESSPELFYRSLANAVSTVRGDLEMDLSEGHWQGQVQGTRIRWRTGANTLMHLTFDYQNGALASAKLRFRPATHLWAGASGASFSVAVDSALYDQYGRIVEWWVRPDNDNATVATTYPALQRALELQTTPGETFTARPFARFANPQRCNASWGGCVSGRPMVEEVRFRNHGSGSGLAVQFRPNATIIFSRSGGGRYDNFVTVRGGSGVVFDHVRYDVAHRELQGHLLDLTVDAQAGEINSGDLRVTMRPGAGVRFGDVRFSRDASGTFVNADLGTLTVDAARGSRVILTRGTANNSHLNLDDGSSLTIRGLQLGIDDQRSTFVRIGAGSNVALQLEGGQLGVGQRGFLALGTGALNATLYGAWDSSEPSPDTHIEVRHLDASVTGGLLPINGETTLALTGGHARSSDLRLIGRNFAGVVGTMDALSVTLADNSTFGVPGSFRVVTGPGARLVAATPTSPLRLYEGVGHPVGTLELTLPFRRFEPARGQSIALRDGTFQLALTQDREGGVAGTGGSLSGTLEAVAQGSELLVKMEIDQLSVDRPAGGVARLDARVRGEVQPGFRMDFETPWTRAGSISLYPVRLVAAIPAAARTTEGRLQAVGPRVTLDSLVFTPTLDLTVPGGRGQHHDFDDPNSADGTHPDDYRTWQEVVVVDEFCNLHLYAAPTSYTVQTRLRLDVQDGELGVKLSRFNPDRSLAWGRDGCKLADALTVVGVLLGGFTPIGNLGGALLGRTIGNNLDDVVDGRIAVGVHEFIAGLEKKWAIRVPPLPGPAQPGSH